MFWTMSRVSGSIEIGPRGLSHFMPFMAAISAVAVGLAAGLLQRLVDQVHAVVAADRDEVRAGSCCAFLNAATYSLFIGELCSGRVDAGGHHAQHRHRPCRAESSSSVMSPGPISLMPALSRPRSMNCLTKVPAWPAGTNTNSASGLRSRGALQERREVRIGERNLDGLDDLAARLGEALGERLSRLPRPGAQSDCTITTFLMPFLRRPFGDDVGLLRRA